MNSTRLRPRLRLGPGGQPSSPSGRLQIHGQLLSLELRVTRGQGRRANEPGAERAWSTGAWVNEES